MKKTEKYSSFGHIEIEYFWERNDEGRPLASKEVLLKQNRHKT